MSEIRTKSIKIRVTAKEHDDLLHRCDKPRLAEWMREVCLKENISQISMIPKTDPALLRQISGIGNNLNQIARAVNRQVKKKSIDLLRVHTELISIEKAMNQLKDNDDFKVS